MASYRRTGRRVYPRVCGGAHVMPPPTQLMTGLSPRVRGSQHASMIQRASLPTWGLSPRVRGSRGPLTEVPLVLMQRVYPRVCGGADHTRAPSAYERLIGSIPACAGEPKTAFDSARKERLRWVYPRVCGGAQLQILASLGHINCGSIPACAGEPPRAGLPACSRPVRVYPRVCGGAGS